MRRSDFEKMSGPYDSDHPSSDRFADALGVAVKTSQELRQEIIGDLDSKLHGVGWWAPHPGTSRRILISDHLLLTLAGIETNLAEAKLHLLELLEQDDEEDHIVANAIRHERDGKWSIKMPKRERPQAELPLKLAALHISGFFRAVGSALDCLGAAIVGVVALPVSILRADVDRAQNAFDKLKLPATRTLVAGSPRRHAPFRR